MGSDVKKLYKDTHNPNPTVAWKDTKGMITPGAPEVPGESPESIAARQQQEEALAMLNDEQNRKLKRLLSAAQGIRAFRGSVISRGMPGNRAGSGGGIFNSSGGGDSGSGAGVGAPSSGGGSYFGGGYSSGGRSRSLIN